MQDHVEHLARFGERAGEVSVHLMGRLPPAFELSGAPRNRTSDFPAGSHRIGPLFGRDEGGRMRRCVRVAGAAAALALFLAACSSAKDTGLPASPTPEPKGGGNAVAVDDNVFKPAKIEVKAGAEVVWTYDGSQPHTVTSDTGIFDSHRACSGANLGACSKKGDPSFTFVFKEAGEFDYYCKIHGFKGGVGMAGTIVVKA
jgi:plastocyanin